MATTKTPASDEELTRTRVDDAVAVTAATALIGGVGVVVHNATTDPNFTKEGLSLLQKIQAITLTDTFDHIKKGFSTLKDLTTGVLAPHGELQSLADHNPVYATSTTLNNTLAQSTAGTNDAIKAMLKGILD